MSDPVIVALITTIGTIVSAAIGARGSTSEQTQPRRIKHVSRRNWFAIIGGCVSLLVGVIIVVLVTPTTPVLQSSFDTSADRWEGYDNNPLVPQAGMVCSTQQPQNPDPWAGIRTDPHISVTPGKQYRVVVRLNTERAVNAHIRVAYHNHTAASADIAIPNPTTPFYDPKAGWQDVPLSTIAPLGAQDILIRIGHGVEPGDGAEPDVVVPDSILCIDDVQVFEE